MSRTKRAAWTRESREVENIFSYALLRQDALALQTQSIKKNRNQIFYRSKRRFNVNWQQRLRMVTKNQRYGVNRQNASVGSRKACFKNPL